MLVGHIGVGLAAKALEPRMKLGTMLAAALLLDIVFFLLMLCGAESVIAPHSGHLGGLRRFDYPYSHSLLSAVFLAFVAAMAWALWGGRRARRHGAYWDGIALIAGTVFSHWVLDLLVQSGDLPLYPGGVGLGLGLGRYQPAALILELMLATGGFLAFVLRSHAHWLRKLLVGIMVSLAACLTIEGVYGPAPLADPSATALFALGLIAVAIGLAAWADSSKSGGLTR